MSASYSIEKGRFRILGGRIVAGAGRNRPPSVSAGSRSMMKEADRLTAIAWRLKESLPDVPHFLESWLEQIDAWRESPDLESLEGERALEALSLDLRYRWLAHAHSVSSRIMMSPPQGVAKFLPNGVRVNYPYDRWLKPDFLEKRLIGHSGVPTGWVGDGILFSNGMSAISTFLQYFRASANRLWKRNGTPLSLHWSGGYFEIDRAMQLLCDRLFAGRRHKDQADLFVAVEKGEPDLVLIEPVAADIGLEVFDLDGFIAAWKRRKTDKPCVLAVDTSLSGHSFPLSRLCLELGPSPPAMVVQLCSGLKLDQEGLEISNAGMISLMLPPGDGGKELLEDIGLELRKARTTLGASLSQNEYAALTAPFFLDGQSMPRHAAAVFANNAAFARALNEVAGPEGGLFTKVVHPAISEAAGKSWAQAPYVNLRYVGDGIVEDGEDARDFLTRVIRGEAKRRNLSFQLGSSFGFRSHRFEMGFVDELRDTSLRVALGSRSGPSLDGVIALFRELNSFPDFAALRKAYGKNGSLAKNVAAGNLSGDAGGSVGLPAASNPLPKPAGYNPCANCQAHCCRQPRVDITVLDAYRISKALNLPADAFAQLAWLEKAAPNRRICLARDGRYYRFRLKRVGEGEDVRCLFLLPLTSRRSICSIYDLRPEVCRTYPSYLEGGGVIATSGGKFCLEGAWSVEWMNVRKVRADWMLNARLQILHEELVDGWNERVFADSARMVEGDFFGFIQSACAEIESRAPEVFERPAAGTPFGHCGWPRERLAELADAALRSLGWRTDETRSFHRPGIGNE